MNTETLPLSRREFLTTPAPSLMQARLASQVPKRPNIIIFMADQMRADSLGCYGHPVAKTPNIDSLARQGVRFSHCYVQNTVCGPSRCSLMTGWPVHVRGHRSLYHFLQPEEPNLFRYLRQNGYEVFWYGKNDLLAPGTFADSVSHWGSAPRRNLRNPWPMEDRRYYSFLFDEGRDRRDYSDYDNLQAGIRVLQRDTSKPFCLFLPLSNPHPPYTAPVGFHNMYEGAKLPRLRRAGLPRKPNFYDAIRRVRRLDQLTESDFRRIQGVYAGMVSYSDWLVGELLEAVDKTGHTSDTAVVLCCDHGDFTGDYGLVEKWPSAVDGVLTHIPLIIRAPGAVQGHVSEEIVELYDVMATCLEWAGIKPQHTHFAHSLLPQLLGHPGDPKRAAHCEAGYNAYERQNFEPMEDAPVPEHIYYPQLKLYNDQPEMVTRATSIRTQDYKLVLRPDGQSEFYDLKRDPLELQNLYGERTSATHQEALQVRLLDWYIRTSDVAPWHRDPRALPKAPG